MVGEDRGTTACADRRDRGRGAAMGGGMLALGLEPSAASDTFVTRSSPSYRASTDLPHFGGDAVAILIHESARPRRDHRPGGRHELEACLAGQTVVKRTRRSSRSFRPRPDLRRRTAATTARAGS